MGPNEGKNMVVQAKCMARAMMCVSASEFHAQYALSKKTNEYVSQHGSLENKWYKIIYPENEVYIYEGDPLEGGQSCEKLPEGANIVTTFDLRSFGKPFLAWFKRVISFLESPAAEDTMFEYYYGPKWNTRLGVSSPEQLSPEFRQAQRAIFFDTEVADLKKTLVASRPGYNDREIIKFRNWLKEPSARALRSIPFPGNPDKLAVGPETLLSFSEYLAEERAKYRADALLYGCVTAIVGICNFCANEVANVKKTKLQDYLFNYINLEQILTSGKQTDPLQILSGTVQNAIDWGYTDELLRLVREFRQIVDNETEKALNSKTVDECLEILYSALPFSIATRIILSTLLDNPAKLGDGIRSVKSSYNIVDEITVRLKMAVMTQVYDFNGDLWRLCKKAIAEKKREKGMAFAEKLANCYIERELYYPRRLKSALLDEYQI